MFLSYLTIALRHLIRHKSYAAINIIGLAIGLTACLLIVLFVQDELSYDRYHAKANRIHRLYTEGRIGDREVRTPLIGAPAGPALVRDYAGVESATRLREFGSYIVHFGDRKFKEEGVVFADSNFFEVFSIPLIKGNPKKALTEPGSVVITQTIAKKYFGNIDPIGKMMNLGSDLFQVTGVCADVPANTHFHYTLFASLSSIHSSDTWMQDGCYHYLVLKDGFDARELEAKSPELVAKYIGPEIQLFMGISLEEFKRQGNRFGFFLQPITDIHLHSSLEEEIETNGDIRYVYIFSAVAFFILLIACINFMNLSTAGSASRAKEVGIRKVLGSVQPQLIRQFLTESVLLTFLALLLSLLLVQLLLPGFNQLTGKQLSITWISPWLIPSLVGFGLLVGLLAGSYPAFFLSAFQPVKVLKGRVLGSARGSFLRQGLVVFQFTVSITLIICTTIVYQQWSYIQNKKTGFDKEQVLVIHDTYSLGQQAKTFRDMLAQLPGVGKASFAGTIPAGASNRGVNGFQAEKANGSLETHRAQTYFIDEYYLETLGMQVVKGRNFSSSMGTDSSAVLINEAAARDFGWADPIGKRISSVGNGTPESKRTYTIVGVVQDFHFENLRQKISPLVMYYGDDNYQVALRVQTDNLPHLLMAVEKNWKALSDNSFAYSFLNERFSRMYQSEQRTGQIFGIFAGLAIVIACLGLFGLVAFTVQQRTKEIGIRKVLGATVSDIVTLLSGDFLRLVLLANLIAFPLAWYAMHRWLQDYAYRVGIGWWVFALAGLAALFIALLTVSFQAIKAAWANPVKSLRTE